MVFLRMEQQNSEAEGTLEKIRKGPVGNPLGKDKGDERV